MSKMIISRVCQRCGKIFKATRYTHYCPDCLKQVRYDSLYKERICIDCGRNFMGYPPSKRCPNCNQENRKEINRNRQKHGSKRPLGSIDKCAICGKEYIVKTPRQKYCSEICAKQGFKKYEKTQKVKKAYKRRDKNKERSKELRENTYNICKYCGATFKPNLKNILYCSDYCHKKADNISHAIYEEKNRNGKRLKNLLEEREEYRKNVANNPPE